MEISLRKKSKRPALLSKKNGKHAFINGDLRDSRNSLIISLSKILLFMKVSTRSVV